ncbi:MAG: outer membrane protein assembly factor BamC [Pseudomonadota bacterium]
MSHLLKTVGWCLLVSVMGGCSTINKALPDHRNDYKKSKIAPPLEIPPDLIGSTHIEAQMLVPTDTLSDSEQTSKREPPQVKVLLRSAPAQIKGAKKPTSRAQLTRTNEGQMNLIVHEDFAQAWQRTGQALDRIEFTVEDRDRSRGIYFIRYIDPDAAKKDKGVFSTLFDSKSTPDSQEYLISLRDGASSTRIVVLNNKGQIEASKTTENILMLLHEQLL